ncbi:MAG: hypothetical protein A3K03_01920 [Bdellovibrionales bacterium RIFOXYD1_FULL_44_7]|nr:MAG: hypothetical protein A3K03_01920 [Bdellovibrionales bacterium RIFOXYD1_FULL_44_7]
MSNKTKKKENHKESTKKSKAVLKAVPQQEVVQPQVDAEELEAQEDAAAEAAASKGGNEAALAAAATSTEMSASFKNFRHHPDMENFYRFIYENDLRLEALQIIDQIMVQKQNRKFVKLAKTHAH